MPLPESFLELSAKVRPRIVKLARQERLVDEAFRLFRQKVYPGASPDQIAALRTAFMAGACEIMTLITYAADTSTMDATDEDLQMMGGINSELQRFHERTLQAADANPENPQ